MSDVKTGTVLGHRIIAKGVIGDSYDLQIDPNAYYDYEHIGQNVLKIYRTGLPSPNKPKPIKRK